MQFLLFQQHSNLHSQDLLRFPRNVDVGPQPENQDPAAWTVYTWMHMHVQCLHTHTLQTTDSGSPSYMYSVYAIEITNPPAF
eukprot:jgi/Botrbrau1/11627/Bobra.0209s0018.1